MKNEESSEYIVEQMPAEDRQISLPYSSSQIRNWLFTSNMLDFFQNDVYENTHIEEINPGLLNKLFPREAPFVQTENIFGHWIAWIAKKPMIHQIPYLPSALREFENLSMDKLDIRTYNIRYSPFSQFNMNQSFFDPEHHQIFVERLFKRNRWDQEATEVVGYTLFIPEFRSNYMRKMKHLYLLPWL